MKKYLLFDLDGTLTDPKQGICSCVQYALHSFGIEEPDLDKLEPFIGPPLKDSFMMFYGMDETRAEEAIAKYRERFSTEGLFENEVYLGVPQMLKQLTDAGMILAVASSKPTVFVERILEHFHINEYFKVVVGSELDGRRSNKEEVVAEALSQLFGNKPIKREEVYMIGDRKFDTEGARQQGIESVGVTYGYGGMQELMEAHTDYIVRSVEELTDFLLRGYRDVKQGLDFHAIWKFGYPFLLFLLVKSLAVYAVGMVYSMLGGSLGSLELLLFDENGAVTGYTGNAYAFMQLVGFLTAAAVTYKTAKLYIAYDRKESRLLFLNPIPVVYYLWLAVATIGAMFGLNMLLELTGMTNSSEAYRTVAADQYSANLILGLVLYVLVAPVSEELLFRGIIYNCLKYRMKKIPAVVIAAVFFGIYHGNSVQGIYGFLMGCLLIYGYEYFGSFKVPVAMHMGVNLISYLLGNTPLAISGFVNRYVCAAFLLIGALGIYSLVRGKKVF